MTKPVVVLTNESLFTGKYFLPVIVWHFVGKESSVFKRWEDWTVWTNYLHLCLRLPLPCPVKTSKHHPPVSGCSVGHRYQIPTCLQSDNSVLISECFLAKFDKLSPTSSGIFSSLLQSFCKKGILWLLSTHSVIQHSICQCLYDDMRTEKLKTQLK